MLCLLCIMPCLLCLKLCFLRLRTYALLAKVVPMYVLCVKLCLKLCLLRRPLSRAHVSPSPVVPTGVATVPDVRNVLLMMPPALLDVPNRRRVLPKAVPTYVRCPVSSYYAYCRA